MSTTASANNEIIRRTARRLIPFLALTYFVSFLDRVNIGFAALTMNKDIGLSASQFGTGAGVFFIGYFLFTVPGNLLLQRIGAARWIGSIMIVWGLISGCMAFVQTPTQFYIARFLLGSAESGFLPGIILYLTSWFPNGVRGRIIGNFFAAVPLSNVVGGPLSTWLLDKNVAGLAGWQTMFVIEALPAILLGMVALRFLDDRPADAKWLTQGERAALEGMLASERLASTPSRFLDGLSRPLVWIFGLLYFLIVLGLYGFGFWAPQIFVATGNLTHTQAGFAIAVPYLVSAALMFLWARHSDTTGERHWHVALPVLLASAGFALAASTASFPVALLGFTFAAVGIYAACPVFWTLPAASLSGAAAASGIALVNSLGNVAGYAGPALMGTLKEQTGHYSTGLLVLAASMAAAGAVAVATGRSGTRPAAVSP